MYFSVCGELLECVFQLNLTKYITVHWSVFNVSVLCFWWLLCYTCLPLQTLLALVALDGLVPHVVCLCVLCLHLLYVCLWAQGRKECVCLRHRLVCEHAYRNVQECMCVFQALGVMGRSSSPATRPDNKEGSALLWSRRQQCAVWLPLIWDMALGSN